MKFDEIRAEGRIRPEVALHTYEKTGIKPSYNWWQCGIAVVAAVCKVRNSEVFGVIGEAYKTGYIDGFDGRTKNVWELGILSRLRPGNGERYRAGFERALSRVGFETRVVEDGEAASSDSGTPTPSIW